jgi:hypothetical protein
VKKVGSASGAGGEDPEVVTRGGPSRPTGVAACTSGSILSEWTGKEGDSTTRAGGKD